LAAAAVGWPVVILAALGAAAAGYLLLKDNTNEATTATRNFKEAVENANKVLSTAKEGQRSITKAEQESANASIDAAITEIDNKIISLTRKIKEREDRVKKLEKENRNKKFNLNPNSTEIPDLRIGTDKLRTQLAPQNAAKDELLTLRRQIDEARNKLPRSNFDKALSDTSGIDLGGSGDQLDTRVADLIANTIRSIDLLKEQKSVLDETAASAMAHKEQELQLLQREKECLERLNEALQDNQTLRGLTGDQSDDILEGAAAYDDLSTAIDQNGEAAQQLRIDVDGLNTALADNADINTQVVGGLNQDLRRAGNSTMPSSNGGGSKTNKRSV